MATVYRKTVTRKIPAGAELFTRRGQQLARWKDQGGRNRKAPITTGRDGSLRLSTKAGTFTAKYRDGDGIVREVATGCRSKDAALAVLKNLTDRADKIRSGIRTAVEDAIVDHQQVPLADHIAAYVAYLRGRSVNQQRVKTTETRLNEAAKVCGFRRLVDLSADRLDGWLTEQHATGRSAAVVNGYREVWLAFGYWCAGKRKAAKGKWRYTGEKRLTSNPFTGLFGADQNSDRRRQRRSMTEDELRRLLYVALRRPIAEYGRQTIAKDHSERKGKRDTWKLSRLTFDSLLAAVERGRERLKDKPEFLEELERRGRQRALIYKALVLTGLRRGELASLTVGSLHLNGPFPMATLEAGSAKNRQQAEVPLRKDLVEDLRRWVTELASSDAGRLGTSGGMLSITTGQAPELPAETPLLDVPKQLVKTFNRDLAVAEISKIDDRGHTLDVHALRHSFGTLLSAGDVAPRTAQAAMRHSTIDLTMNVYTDPRLLDVRGALDVLPSLPLDGSPINRQHAQATGTDDADASRPSGKCLVAPTVAPNPGKPCKSETIPDKTSQNSPHSKNEKTRGSAGVFTVGLTALRLNR